MAQVNVNKKIRHWSFIQSHTWVYLGFDVVERHHAYPLSELQVYWARGCLDTDSLFSETR